MSSSILLGAVLAWAAILVLAILNGIARETLLVPAIGETAARAASGLVLASLVYLVAYVAIPYIGAVSVAQAWAIGLLWTMMTLVFEFGFGFAQHKRASELREAYTFRRGNLWPLVLLMTLIAPWLVARVQAGP